MWIVTVEPKDEKAITVIRGMLDLLQRMGALKNYEIEQKGDVQK